MCHYYLTKIRFCGIYNTVNLLFISMSSDISFNVPSTSPSKGEAELPPFLTTVRNPEHVLRVQMDPLLTPPLTRRGEKRKTMLVLMMAVAIMGITIPAMVGIDITSPGGGPTPTQVEAPKD